MRFEAIIARMNGAVEGFGELFRTKMVKIKVKVAKHFEQTD